MAGPSARELYRAPRRTHAASPLFGDRCAAAATYSGSAARASASAMAFLALDEASYVTGALLAVDGGRSGLTPGTVDATAT